MKLLKIVAAALALLLVSPLAAGVKDCDDPKWSEHPSCAEPDPGSDPLDIHAQYLYGDFQPREEAEPWDGPYPQEEAPFLDSHPWTVDMGMPAWDDFEENTLASVPRQCQPIDTTNGNYGCNFEGSRGGRISFDLTVTTGWKDLAPIKKQRYPEYCQLLNDWSSGALPAGSEFDGQDLTFGVTWYYFAYEDGVCTELNCPIRVSTIDLLPGLHPFTDLFSKTGYDLPDVEQIMVYGLIDTTFPDGIPEDGNIFTEYQLLPVDQIEIKFVSGRALATCGGSVTPGAILFETVPIP